MTNTQRRFYTSTTVPKTRMPTFVCVHQTIKINIINLINKISVYNYVFSQLLLVMDEVRVVLAMLCCSTLSLIILILTGLAMETAMKHPIDEELYHFNTTRNSSYIRQ